MFKKRKREEERVDHNTAFNEYPLVVSSAALHALNEQNVELLGVVREFARTVKHINKRLARVEDKIRSSEESEKTKPLWKFVTEKSGVCRDIFERHIVTKLNGTDQKFLYATNTESREAMRRANIKLRDKFFVHEMSSRSTLRLAWEHYPWGQKGKYDSGNEYTKNQEQFSRRVAAANKLDLLQWLREVKECTWDDQTSGFAVTHGNLAMLKYCVENGCRVHAGTCLDAAKYGHLACLKYLREKNCPWNSSTVYWARTNNHMDCLKYALEQKCPEPTAAEVARYLQ